MRNISFVLLIFIFGGEEVGRFGNIYLRCVIENLHVSESVGGVKELNFQIVTKIIPFSK